MKVTKKLFKELTSNKQKLYTSDKYVCNGEIALIKEVIDNPNEIIEIGVETIVSNQNSFNSVLDSYKVLDTNNNTLLKCDYVDLSEFQYKLGQFNVTGSYNSNHKLNALFNGTDFYSILTKNYVDNTTQTKEVTIGISEKYLNIFNKLNKEFKGNLKLKEVVYRCYADGSSYQFINGFYKIMNGKEYIGVIMGVQVTSTVDDMNTWSVLEPLDDTKDRVLVGEHIQLDRFGRAVA